jgi:prepilin-type N-terminal cleavage/methylation domain-containing protein
MSVQSTPEFGIRLRAHLAGRRRGFTAIEMVAVATIMVILSLILVLNVRKRVDESKVAAAKDEINELSKIESLVFAETGHFFILQDLDNTDNYPAVSGTDLPVSYYAGTTVTVFQVPNVNPLRQALVKSTNQWNTNGAWEGPYTTFKRFALIGDLAALRPELFWDPVGGHFGPIMPLIANDDKYPLDPWGNPYIFEVRLDSAGKIYGGRIYSLGPDGMPGIVLPSAVVQPFPTTADGDYANGKYFHTPSATYPTGQLGITGRTGDDLVIEF